MHACFLLIFVSLAGLFVDGWIGCSYNEERTGLILFVRFPGRISIPAALQQCPVHLPSHQNRPLIRLSDL